MPRKLGVLPRFFCFFLFLSTAYGQSTDPVERILSESPRQIVGTYQASSSANEVIRIPMNFNDFRAEEKASWRKLLRGKDVLAIDLVYTDFPRGRDFEPLNRNRLSRLEEMLPDLLRDTTIDWRYIGQNDCQTLTEAEGFFHGFAIYYKPRPSAEKFAPKRDTLEQEVATVKPKKEKKKPTRPAPEPDEVTPYTVREMLERGYITPDSLIVSVLERFPKWEEIAIVNDCTGSMYAYNVEVISWFRQQQTANPRTKWFTFFNDGDYKPDKKKRIGKTGGVYMVRAQEIDKAQQTMLRTMSSGGGGDTPENDMEAILMTAKNCEDCQEIVLVADAWSSVRDIRLLRKYMRKYAIPIRVILCGAERGVAPEYLTMAYQSGGSVHTIEDDLDRLQDLPNEGEVKIGYHVFKLFGDEFVLFRRNVPTEFGDYR